MPTFTLSLFNLTNHAPTVMNISLQKQEGRDTAPAFSIVDGQPITAQGQLTGELELETSRGGLSRNSLELAYGFAPGGPTVLVQFGIAQVKENAKSYPYIGAPGAVPSMEVESYLAESTKQDVYTGIVVIRFVEL